MPLFRSVPFRSWYREVPISEGVSEFFATFRFQASDGSAQAAIAEAFSSRYGGQGIEGVSVTAFHPEGFPFSSAFLDFLNAFAPVSFIGGRGDGISIVFAGYRIAARESDTGIFRRFETPSGGRGTVLRTPGATRTTLDAVSFPDGDFAFQVGRFYDCVAEALPGGNPKTFVRSWNYVDSILSRYGEFNRVRDARFRSMGVAAPYPAWTGIDAVLDGGRSMEAFAEFASSGSVAEPKISHYRIPWQCEADSYGPKFSRAVSVESDGWRRVHVSWTASVGQGGETLNSDDIGANVAHTMETVRELLSVSGADFGHVVRSNAYFKRPEFVGSFEAWGKSRGVPDLPCAYNVCDVCRADWLFEFECVAYVPVSRTAFVEFRLPGEALGNKSEHFRILADAGFPVPESLAASGMAADRIANDAEERARFDSEVSAAFPGVERFAVRSSSLAEDGGRQSKAGAFLSLTDVPRSGLADAVGRVRTELERTQPLSDFGVLVQRYVPLSTFGVAFTCDPEFGSHSMVAEYSKGPGESLVSGKNVPKRVRFSRRAPVSSRVGGIDWGFWQKTFLRAESAFGVPQDIEWGIGEDGVPVVLQSRPITTLAPGELRTIRELDRFETERSEPGKIRTFVRNELREAFSSPTEAELGFLRTLYAHPAVVGAYARWGIRYVPADFLAVADGFLYVDETAERRCFDPAWTVAAPFVRLKNAWVLGSVGPKIAYGGPGTLKGLERRMFESLAAAVETVESGTVPDIGVLLDRCYGPVFETNFLASSYHAFLRQRNADSPVSAQYVPADAGEWSGLFAKIRKLGLVGNSIAFSDRSAFSTPLFERKRYARTSDLPVSAGAALDFLREAGRAVSVMCAHLLRPADAGSSHSWRRVPDRLEFPVFEDVSAGNAEWDVLSSGTAEGRLVEWNPSVPLPESEGPFVALVEILDPSLADILPASVMAVVSRRGGRLSHFAIVARERGLPTFVIAGRDVASLVGQTVRVDADGMVPVESDGSVLSSVTNA